MAIKKQTPLDPIITDDTELLADTVDITIEEEDTTIEEEDIQIVTVSNIFETNLTSLIEVLPMFNFANKWRIENLLKEAKDLL